MKSFLFRERFGRAFWAVFSASLFALTGTAQAQFCDFSPNATITVSAVGGNNSPDFSTRFVLTDSSGAILQINTAPTFAGRPTGLYAVYAINYKTANGINNLAVGQNISAVGGTCVAISRGLNVSVCECDYGSGDTIRVNAIGGNNGPGYTTEYALTYGGGEIVAIRNMPSFPPQLPGLYTVYAVNYRVNTGVSNLVVGQNISAVGGVCVAISSGLSVTVCGCDFTSNNVITATSIGGNASPGFTNRYVLANIFGTIVDIRGAPVFPPQPPGFYAMYAINYRIENGISNLAIGQAITAISGVCFDISSALPVGVCPPPANVSIVGSVRLDINGNGVAEPGDTNPIPNVEIRIFSGTNLVLTLTNNPDGNFAVTNLPPGEYTVVQVVPPGYTPTTPTNIVLVLSGGETGQANYLDYLPAVVTGHLYYDRNGNGRQDAGEPNLTNVTVRVTSGTNIVLVTTDASGNWSATVPPGSVTNKIDTSDADFVAQVPPGYIQTEGNDPTVVNAPGGQTTFAGNDGFYTPAMVNGHVYYDRNGNGTQDPGEPNITNVTVRVTSGTNIVLVTTDANGNWTASVPPGSVTNKIDTSDADFIVQVPPGYVQTEGTDPTVVTAPPGQSIPAGNDGFYTPATVFGHLYYDSNGNGTQGPGEPNLSNVTVRVTSGTNIVFVTTDANGNWTASVPPGSVTNKIDTSDPDFIAQVPPGYIQTEGNDPTVVTAPPGVSTSAGNDGFYSAGFIGDRVWIDQNGNGIQDPGEPGAPGVQVTLRSGTNVFNTVTDTNGLYGFTNLTPGNYVVIFTRPPGYCFTLRNQGTNAAVDSDADPITGATATNTLVAGESDFTVDAGLVLDVPTIVCPPDLNVSCASNVPPPNPGSVTASSRCGSPVTVTHVGDVLSNSNCLNQFTIARTYRATVAGTNAVTCTQLIRVNDTTPPTISCPVALKVSCAAHVPPPDVKAVTAIDNCVGEMTVVHVGDSISASNCPNRFVVTRTYRATDVCGNSSTCTQLIVVNDTFEPIISCPPTISVNCAANVPAPNTSLVTATDNCAGGVTISHLGDSISASNCANQFIIARTYRAADACGNAATCTQIIIVNDTQPPSIACPAPVTVSCAANVPPPNTNTVITSDNCGGNVLVTHVGDSISNSNCPNRFIITRTYRATDACGNSSTCTQTITVNDTTGLTADAVPAQTACLGSTVTFTTVGRGGCAQTFTYQWFRGGAAIANATNATLVITNVSQANAGTYSVVVSGACNSVTNSTTLTVVNAAIRVTKSCPTNAVAPGATLTFSGSVSNAGNTTLSNVMVFNDRPTNNTLVFGPVILAPGEVRFFSGSYTTPANSCGPWTDTLTARAASACGTNLTHSASATCPSITTPAITLTTRCPDQPTPLGGLVVYTGVVSNSGTATLTNVLVFSEKPTNNTLILGPITLAPGQWRAFTNSYQLPPHDCCGGPTRNMLTARGTDLCTGSNVVKTSTLVCPVLTTPAIQVYLSCPSSPVSAGQQMWLYGNVENTGNVALSNVVLVAGNGEVLLEIDALAPGEYWDFAHQVTFGNCSGPVTNRVTGSGSSVRTGERVTNTATCVMSCAGGSPPMVISPMLMHTESGVSFDTQAGVSYTVECTDSLRPPVQWTPWTNVIGTGLRMDIMHSRTNDMRFYRVWR